MSGSEEMNWDPEEPEPQAEDDVESSSAFGDLLERQEVLDAFREAWHKADDLGMNGGRVAHGLEAALKALDGTAPVGPYIVVDAEALRKGVQVSLSSARAVLAPAVTYLRKMGLLDGTGL